MKIFITYFIIFLPVVLFIGCKSVSRYAIDDEPSVKIDTNLLGIWKAVEDTNKKDFFVVQANDDIFPPSQHSKQGHKKGVFFIDNDNCYAITRMDQGGMNPTYQEWSAFLSQVNKYSFLNISYHYIPFYDDSFHRNQEVNGYFFVRIIHLNANHDSLATTIVSDTTLKYLSSSKEVRKRIEKNLDNPSFYSDTLHFYKVNGYHASLKGTILKAN